MSRFNLIPTKCAICETEKNFQVLYTSNIKNKDFNPVIFSARRIPDKLHFQIVKCRKCSLVRSNPIINPKLINTFYRQSLFNYQDETANLTKTYLKALSSILKNLPKDARILEVGCGNGFLLKALYDKGYKNIFGIEPSTDAISKSHKTIKKHIKKGILKLGQFKRESFDLIFFFQTLDHIFSPNQFLKLCFNLLSPNGYILAFNHNINSLSYKILREKSPIIDIEHTYLFSPKTIQLIFEKNKFTPLKIYTPANFVSLKHLIRLLPIPNSIKSSLLGAHASILSQTLLLKLGNLCIIATKDD